VVAPFALSPLEEEPRILNLEVRGDGDVIAEALCGAALGIGYGEASVTALIPED
jgi:hypothetical protein